MKQFGHFDDTNKEYVIERPDTPMPWLNYLGQDEFFGIFSNTGGGYSFWKDARMRRLTRYRYNTAPMDMDGRILYVKDGEDVWCPSWKPVRAKLDSYECRHGLGYSKISSSKNGVKVDAKYFVPCGENLELWNVQVTNTSDKPKTVSLFSYVEFCIYEALVDMTNYQRGYSIGEVEVHGGMILHKTEYRERRDHYTLFGSTHPVDGFDTSREDFLGTHNGVDAPQAVMAGKCTDSVAHGWNPIGSHQINFELQPGETKATTFVLAYIVNNDVPKFIEKGVVNRVKADAIMAKYSDQANVDKAFDDLKAYWNTILTGCEVEELPHETMKRMINIWNPYQCMATFNLSRSASGYETGIGRGMGFRDSNQDLLGFVHMIPERARERIIDLASTQLSDGECFHQYQPLTKQGNAEIGGEFNDDPMWMILSTCAYIRETGDTSILAEKVGFADKKDADSTLLDHLEISTAYTLRERGPHKLPLIGHADWNDCLNLNCFSDEPNESFQCAGDVADSIAESLMIAGLFLYTMKEFAALYDFLGKGEDKARIDGYYTEMLAAVEEHGWDGDWYLRAFDAAGKPVGTKESKEAQIFIESQGWLVLGGAGMNNGRAEKALQSVYDRLYSKGVGIALIDPSYSEYHRELGEITSYPPGYKENGGVFSHNNTWVQIAETMVGNADRAVEYWESISPAMREDYSLYRSEPYVFAQAISSQHSPKPGEGKNSWLTGTAAWSYVVGVQHILGVRPSFEGLNVAPVIPQSWDGFKLTRRFRGVNYHIAVKNNAGAAKVVVDGKEVEGTLVPLAAEGVTDVNVEVSLA